MNTQFQLVEEMVFSTPLSNSPAAAGYLKVQLNSTQFWHYLPGDSIRFHRLWAQSHRTALQPTSDAICKRRLLPVLLTDWLTDYISQLSTTSSFGSINLLKQLTELREIFYLLHHEIIGRGYNSGAARWKRCIEQSMWERPQSFHASSRCYSLHISTNPALFESYPFGCLGRLH